jgi:1,2-diacylglycerol 3-alpha-glucosyltransferase
MKIIHVCLSNFYADGYAYQENQLVRHHVEQGHDVTVIASTETFDLNREITYLAPSDYIGQDGARVIRLPYFFGPLILMKKLRVHIGFSSLLKLLKPDLMVFHGLCGWEILSAASYCRKYKIRLYADSHEDFNNSARSFFSKWILHWMYYRVVLKIALPNIKEVLCISKETELFVNKFYGVDSLKIKLFPLGGRLISDENYESTRKDYRALYGWKASERVFLQSGKFDEKKKLKESLTEFSKLKQNNLRFIIVGEINSRIYSDILKLIENDSRIIFSGWQDAKQLENLLCAADCYVQPGSQSATMQMALCMRKPVILADVLSHEMYVSDNGILVSNSDELRGAFLRIAEMSNAELESMSLASNKFAVEFLDYSMQAKYLTNFEGK